MFILYQVGRCFIEQFILWICEHRHGILWQLSEGENTHTQIGLGGGGDAITPVSIS